jgi:hypothetical protein
MCIQLLPLLCNALTAFNEVSSTSFEGVLSASDGSSGWTAPQYCAAALLLLDNPNNAVTEEHMQAVLGSHVTSSTDKHQQQLAGTPALRALLKTQKFILRPYSDWAVDIPHEAYYDANKQAYSTLVTASDPVQLYCMRLERSELEERMQLYGRPYKVTTPIHSNTRTSKRIALQH